MELTLKRKIFNPANTEGELFMDDKHFCWVLEDKVRSTFGKIWDKLLKVKGQTAIPYGRYRVIVNPSVRFKRRLPLLLNVPSFDGIRIHNGITEKHTEGCPLVSYNKSSARLISDNKRAMNDITDIIEKEQNNHKEVWITITN